MKNIGNRRSKVPFSMIEIPLIENPNLRGLERSVLIYLLSRPENWKVNQKDIVNKHFDGETAIKNAINGLKKKGYLSITRIRDKKGRIVGSSWVYDSVPFVNDPEISSEIYYDNEPHNTPQVQNTLMVKKPQVENHPTDKHRMEIKPNNYINSNYIHLNYINNTSLSEKKKIEQFADNLANRNGKTPVAYKKALLEDWEREGLKTLDAVKFYVGDMGDKNIKRKEMVPDWLNEHEHAHQKMHSETDLEKIKQMKELQSKILSFRNEQK